MGLKAQFRKAFPAGAVIEAEFELALGSFGLTVLFGPSGCGKTTVLRCLAGLERPDAGLIQAGEEIWYRTDLRTALPAARRGIGYVFQESALFPHLSVVSNIAFGLHGWPRAERQAWVAELIQLVGLGGFTQRRPGELSGGQKQRVALARALAPRPRLLLLDEPFASLDEAATGELRHQLRQTLQALRVPGILVTHDPQEALALGDRMLLMSQGRIIRDGSPAEVLSAQGDPARTPMGDVVRVKVLGRTEGLLHLQAGSAQLFAPDPGGRFEEAYACIRAEGVALETGPHGNMSQRNRLSATITGVASLGALVRVRLNAGLPLDAVITAWAWEDLRLQVGHEVQAIIKASAIQVIPIEP